MSIENKEITISLKMAWTAVASIVFGAVSLVCFYFGLSAQIKDAANFADNKNQLQDLQYQNLYLNVQKIEIDLKEMHKQINERQNNEKSEK